MAINRKPQTYLPPFWSDISINTKHTQWTYLRHICSLRHIGVVCLYGWKHNDNFIILQLCPSAVINIQNWIRNSVGNLYCRRNKPLSTGLSATLCSVLLSNTFRFCLCCWGNDNNIVLFPKKCRLRI